MNIDIFWSFRSPYSYLATPDMLRLKEEFAVQLNLKVVLPIAIRNPDALFNPANAARARYIMIDWPRRARFLGMSDRWPVPDPIVQNPETLEISEEQPYIYRLSHLGVEAQRRGKGVEFAYHVSHLLFGGQQHWDKGNHLAEAVAKAGLNLQDMELALNDNSHIKDIEDNHKLLEKFGHWGVPTFVVEDEPFFGQDRIDTLRWHLTNCGLKR